MKALLNLQRLTETNFDFKHVLHVSLEKIWKKYERMLRKYENHAWSLLWLCVSMWPQSTSQACTIFEYFLDFFIKFSWLSSLMQFPFSFFVSSSFFTLRERILQTSNIKFSRKKRKRNLLLNWYVKCITCMCMYIASPEIK